MIITQQASVAAVSAFASVAAVTAVALVLPPCSGTLDLSGYQRSNGAITVHVGGDYVDPYFATKALIVARSFGSAFRRTRSRIGGLTRTSTAPASSCTTAACGSLKT